MSIALNDIASLIAQSEGQYFDRKSLWDQPPKGRRPRDRRAVRDQIAEPEKVDRIVKVEPRQALAQLVQQRGFVQSRDFQTAFGVGRYKAWSELTALVASGVLTRHGERRWTKYRPGPKWDQWLYDAQFSI